MTGSVTTGPSFYEILGVSPSAGEREIAEAYATRIQKHLVAPDHQEAGSQGEARAVMRAYRTLSDPDSRRAYDASLSGSVELASSEPSSDPVPFMATRLRNELGRDAADPMIDPDAGGAGKTLRSRPRTDDLPSKAPRRKPSKFAAPAPAALAGTGPAEAAQPDEPADAGDQADRHHGAFQEETFTSGPFLAEPALPTRQIPDGAKVAAGMLGVGLLATAAWLLSPGAEVPGDSPRGSTAPAAQAGAPDAAGSAEDPASTQALAEGDEGQELPAELAALVPPPGPMTAMDREGTAAADTQADGAALAAQNAMNAFPESELESIPSRTIATTQPANPAVAAAAAAAAVARSMQTTQPDQSVQAGQPVRQGQPAVAQQVASQAAPTPLQSLPQLREGTIRNSDNPRGRFQGIVSVEFVVQPNGRVVNCRTADSSGNQDLDQRTCQLVEQRLVFDPALDNQGRAIPWTMRGTYVWGSRRWRSSRR